MKVCSRCCEEKPLSAFHKRADRKIGVQSHCKECQKIRRGKYYAIPKNAARANIYSTRYYWNNREKALAENKRWRDENNERRKQYSQEYEKDRRVRLPEKRNLYARKYLNKRYRTDFKYRLNRIISTGIKRSLNAKKNGFHWEDILGYCYLDLIKRLKKTIPQGYRWIDYEAGKTNLSIDHIIPVSAFNFSTFDDLDFKRCWALSNLRLISLNDNKQKSDKLLFPFQPCLKF